MRKFLTIGGFFASCAAGLALFDSAEAGESDSQYVPLSHAAPLTESEAHMDARLDSAEYALNSGLPAVAQQLVENFFSNSPDNIPDELADKAKGLLTDSLIAQGKFEQAARGFSDEESGGDEWLLRRAIVDIGLGSHESAEKAISKIDPEKLSKYGQYTLLIARGYLKFEKSDYPGARADFAKAKELSRKKTLFATAEIADGMCALAGDAPEGELSEYCDKLGEKARFYFGTKLGFEYAKQYAVALNRMGRSDEALDVIRRQLSIKQPEDVETGEIALIKIAIEKNAQDAFSELKKILKKNPNERTIDYIIAVVQQNRMRNAEETEKFLMEAKEIASPSSKDKFLLELAATQMALGKLNAAVESATKILEEFPNSSEFPDALRIVAWASFTPESGKAPQYRLAAASLMKLASMESDPSSSNKTKLMAADCFFLNKDYDTAANIYKSLFGAKGVDSGIALNRALESALAGGGNAFLEAEKLLDSAYSAKIPSDSLWSAEWKLSEALEKKHGLKSAKERIKKALAFANSANDDALKIRLLWRSAKLARDSGDVDEVVKICDEIVSESEKSRDEILSEAAANALLMKARAFEDASFDKNSKDSENLFGKSIETYELLRSKYPNSDAALISHLHQARALASRELYPEAKALCEKLASLSEKYAYSALMDSASYSRKMGMRSDYLNALHTLDKLISDYPDNPSNFYARLEQGDIMRLLNSFSDARALYTDMTNRYASHPDVRLAWLGLGDSVLALKGESAANDAAQIFERLYAMPENTPSARAEAAYKWAFATAKAGRKAEADEIRWITASAILESRRKPGSDFDKGAEYWVSRLLLDLAASQAERGNPKDSRAAYELIVSEKLPSAGIAGERLKR